jgi:hypothetical protein
MLAEEDEDESPHMDTDETDEEVQDTGPAFDDDLDSEVDDFTIEEDDCVFMAMVHLVNPHYFVHALSMASRRLVEVFAKNSKLKGFVFLSPTTHHLPIHLLAIISVWPTLHLRECMGWWGGHGRWSVREEGVGGC